MAATKVYGIVTEVLAEEFCDIAAKALGYPKRCSPVGSAGGLSVQSTWTGFGNCPPGWVKRPTTTWIAGNVSTCVVPVPDAMAAALAAPAAQARLTPQDRAALNTALGLITTIDTASYTPKCPGDKSFPIAPIPVVAIAWDAWCSDHAVMISPWTGTAASPNNIYTDYGHRKPSMWPNFDQWAFPGDPAVDTQAIKDAELLSGIGAIDAIIYDLYPPASAWDANPADRPPQCYINQPYDKHITSQYASQVKHCFMIFPIWMSQDGPQADWSNPGWGTWTKLSLFIADMVARMNDPNYLKIDGRPVIGLFGGVVSAPNTAAWASAWATISAALPQFYLIVTDGSQSSATLHGARWKGTYGPNPTLPGGSAQYPWRDQRRLDCGQWPSSGGGIFNCASVTPLQDRRPRQPGTTAYVDQPTTLEFAEHINAGFGYRQAGIGKAGLVLAYANTEISEGGPGMLPVDQEGTRYYDAIRLARGTGPSTVTERIDAHQKNFTVTGAGWTYVQQLGAAYHNSDEMRSSTPGDRLDFSAYNCIRLEVWAAKGPDRGIANVYLDGILQGTVDLYSPTTVTPASVWSSGTLARGTHTLGVEVSGTKNPASSSTLIGYDACQSTVSFLHT